jgi:ABC-type transporter Mla maintaining outer membrane lipid asymmetry ATPase subunit MlaF
MIHFDNVCKNFDGKQVLAGVSFDVVEGEILAIVGPSGTGKSVTLKHIVGLLTPDSGTVTVREGARIGYLFQGGALLAWLTVRENVSLPLRETTKLSEDEIANYWPATTGISQHLSPNTQHPSTTYNLNGQRINGNVKGLIIKNGKKVTVK